MLALAVLIYFLKSLANVCLCIILCKQYVVLNHQQLCEYVLCLCHVLFSIICSFGASCTVFKGDFNVSSLTSNCVTSLSLQGIPVLWAIFNLLYGCWAICANFNLCLYVFKTGSRYLQFLALVAICYLTPADVKEQLYQVFHVAQLLNLTVMPQQEK